VQAVPLPNFDRRFIDREEALADAVARLESAEGIGLDVEMGQRIERLPGGVTRGKQLLALIQIAGNGMSLIVDPLRVKDLSLLQPMLSSPSIKVVLGGATDIQLLEERKLMVHNVVDLAEVAISVFGHKEEGMRALADRALGIQIDKSIRREDWLRRPINPSMLSYAHRDAELTLLLYQWFQDHHPEAVTAHTRKHYHPTVPADIPEWIRRCLTKRVDVERLLKELKIDPAKESDRLAQDLRKVWPHDFSPSQQRRLIRITGDLRLKALMPEVLPYAKSPSSVFRSAAARALGRMGSDDSRPVLDALLKDDIADVVAAAEMGIRDLNAGMETPQETQVEDDDTPALKPEALAALESMRDRLPGDAPT
jgi:hypothetical protein